MIQVSVTVGEGGSKGYLGVVLGQHWSDGLLEQFVRREVCKVRLRVLNVDIVQPKVLANFLDSWHVVCSSCGRQSLVTGLVAVTSNSD